MQHTSTDINQPKQSLKWTALNKSQETGTPPDTTMEEAPAPARVHNNNRTKLTALVGLLILTLFISGTGAWTGEIHGRVICDVCGDSALGPEDHILEGAEVAVLCITKSGEVLNYQAFTNAKGRYTVAETMPASDRWDACLARPISSFHEHCSHLGDATSGVKFSYNHPSGYSHTVRSFVYRPSSVPTYCT